MTQCKGIVGEAVSLQNPLFYKEIREPERLYSGMENPALSGSYITKPQPVEKDKLS